MSKQLKWHDIADILIRSEPKQRSPGGNLKLYEKFVVLKKDEADNLKKDLKNKDLIIDALNTQTNACINEIERLRDKKETISRTCTYPLKEESDFCSYYREQKEKEAETRTCDNCADSNSPTKCRPTGDSKYCYDWKSKEKEPKTRTCDSLEQLGYCPYEKWMEKYNFEPKKKEDFDPNIILKMPPRKKIPITIKKRETVSRSCDVIRCKSRVVHEKDQEAETRYCDKCKDWELCTSYVFEGKCKKLKNKMTEDEIDKSFKKYTTVCQNCKFGNNDKGKRIKKIFNNVNKKIGSWHVFCNLKGKWYPWDKRKRCFTEK
jgi:hypothetical protein